MNPITYLNGKFIPQSDAHLGLNDAGFVFGATATDLLRTFRHVPFRLADHLERFRNSCRIARIPQLLDDVELADIVHRLIAHNAGLLPRGHDLAVVLLATPGPIGYYLGQPGGPGDGPPTLCMHTFPLPFARYLRLFRMGARLVIPPTCAVPAGSVDPRVKQRSRLHWWLAEQEAHAIDPTASALLSSADGHITETAGANILLVFGDTVISPPRETILGGISLRVLEELCQPLGLRFEERPLTLDDCFRADEILLSSTPYCVAGVSSVEGRTIRWPGPVLGRFLDAWSQMVGVDVRGQIEGAVDKIPPVET